ncbi:nucleotidyltransferase family protein [Desulfurococcus mucosus]|uniref:nucleotidyltransferase family protein n=1 Tax=Desulfurococcus mucosus TaxID=2275 RepID=UPI001FE22EE2|nr:nucleotidyltransferase family protein [Desulfurococcus mucosus]
MVTLLQGDVTAVVLAGGQGERFRPYTEIIPKPMIPVGNNEKPVLELVVKWLRRHGVSRIVFLVNYKWRYIYNYFGDGSRFDVSITYSIDEEGGYSNTGGAILKAYRDGLIKGRALIWYGDILAPLDVPDLLRYHSGAGSDLTLVVTNRYRVPVGVVKVDNDYNVVEMREKPELDINATIGVAVAELRVFSEGLERELGRDFDFMGNLVPWLINNGYRVKAYIYSGEWFDVGSLERYKKLDMEWVTRVFDQEPNALSPASPRPGTM